MGHDFAERYGYNGIWNIQEKMVILFTGKIQERRETCPTLFRAHGLIVGVIQNNVIEIKDIADGGIEVKPL